MDVLRLAKLKIKKDPRYPKEPFIWLRAKDLHVIPKCVNSLEASKDLQEICQKYSSIFDYMELLALSSFLIAAVPKDIFRFCKPKIVVDSLEDYDHNVEVTFTVYDCVKEYLYKLPSSKPKRDPRAKKVKSGVYREVKASYIFGIQYDAVSKSYRLYSKIYPLKTMWGYRYDKRYKSFEKLLDVVCYDLASYFRADFTNDSAIAEPKTEEEKQAEQQIIGSYDPCG